MGALSIACAVIAHCLDYESITHLFARHEATGICANIFLADFYSCHVAMLYFQASL